MTRASDGSRNPEGSSSVLVFVVGDLSGPFGCAVGDGEDVMADPDLRRTAEETFSWHLKGSGNFGNSIFIRSCPAGQPKHWNRFDLAIRKQGAVMLEYDVRSTISRPSGHAPARHGGQRKKG
jgi:hypothetical protein